MSKRNQPLAFVLLWSLSIWFWWHSLVVTFALVLANDAYTYIILILPLGLALFYFDWKHQDSKQIDSTTLSIESRSGPRLGAALMLLALLIACYARWGMAEGPGDVRLSLAMLALVIWWLASVLLCFGGRTFRSFLFPLFFLFLIVPIPELAVGWIVDFLQQQSAVAARIMFRAIAVPVTQDGIMLSIPGLDIEVARECSSIRSSLMLVVTTMFLAHLFLRSWWRKALLIAVAIPLSVAKNGLRIVMIVELATRVDPGYLDGNLHHRGGIVFFGIAVMAVGALLWALRRSESTTGRASVARAQ